MKNFVAAICVIAMTMAFVTPIQTASALDKIDGSLMSLGLDSEEVTGVFVELDKPPVVQMMTFGGKFVFPATEMIRPDNFSTKFFEASISKAQNAHIKTLSDMIPGFEPSHSYQYAFNGYYVETSRKNLEKIAKFPMVKRIFTIKEKKLYRTRTRALMGAEKVWATVKDPSGRPVDGTGVLVSVSDTGLDYTHPDFGAQSKPVGPKVVVSRDFGDNDTDCQEDEKAQDMHGTNCASLIAGDGPDNKITKVKEKGIAPKSLLAGYKIAQKRGDRSGLSSPAIMATWDNMIKDKVQVSNNSYGAATGYPDMEIPQLNAALAGVTVVASNGNEGSPGQVLFATPLGDTAAANSVIGVGATDDTDFSSLEIFNAPDDEAKGKKVFGNWANTGRTMTSFDTPFQVVDCLWGRKSDFDSVEIKGKIALIMRGPKEKEFGEPLNFKDKVINAANAGAKAVVMYNHSPGKLRGLYYDPQKNEKSTDFNLIPTYELNNSYGVTIRDQLHKGNDWKYGQPDTKQNNVTIKLSKPTYKANIAEYSSHGPSILGFLKPDVCAPGIDIHAALPKWARDQYKIDYYDNFGGTSAAGPFVAGCAALIRQGRPEWNPFEIKRALMNTATMMKRTDGQYYLPLTMQGMGRANVQEAINTQVLIQPPSALLQVEANKYNVADWPSEWLDSGLKNQLPDEIKASRLPFKLSNYSKKPVTYDISFEINASNPQQFDIQLTSTSVKVPAAGKTPGEAWVGFDIKLPSEVTGSLNDVIIWFTDKANNRKLHTGVCIYNYNPRVGGGNNTFASFIKFDKDAFTPNGDGIDDELEVSYEVTNGSWDWRFAPPFWSNYGDLLTFDVIDDNGEIWSTIHIEEEFELGPGKFRWNGKDVDGNYNLPDGDWYIGVRALCFIPNEDMTKLIQDYIGFPLDTAFSVEQSTLPPLPLLTAHVLPLEPGMGQVFEVGLYLKHAKDIKSVSFKMTIPGGSSIVQYMGYEKGEFLIKDEPLALFATEYDKDKEQFDVSIQRPLDGVSGEGYILKLKFMAKDSNYFDIRFSDLVLSMVGENGKETKSKAFYKNGEISIMNKAYDPADFNRDEKVDDADLKILMKSIGSKDGEERYNWRCDLNYDRSIDVNDYSIFAKSFSKR